MSTTVEVGVAEAVLRIKDEFSAGLSKFDARLLSVESQLSKFGSSIKQHSEQGAASFNVLREGVDRLSQTIGGETGEMGEKVVGLSSKLSGLAALAPELGLLIPVVVGIGAAIGGLVAAKAVIESLFDVIKEGSNTEIIVARLNQTLMTIGSSAGLSAHQILEEAESLARMSGMSTEAIKAGESILVRFDKIGHDIFPAASKAALDVAASGEDIASAYQKVGIALQGGQRGIMALKDLGVTFTASQRRMLTEMVETGRIGEYQTIVLRAIQEHVGNLAEAYGDTLVGKIGRANAILDQSKEIIASELIPALKDMIDILIDSAGGWDALAAAGRSAARDIGSIVRDAIFALISSIVTLDEMSIKAGSSIKNVFRSIDEQMEEGSLRVSKSIQVMLAAVGSSSSDINSTISRLKSELEKLRSARQKDSDAIAEDERILSKLSAAYANNSEALAGDTKTYAKHITQIESSSKAAEEERKKYGQLMASITDQVKSQLTLNEAYRVSVENGKRVEEELEAHRKAYDAAKEFTGKYKDAVYAAAYSLAIFQAESAKARDLVIKLNEETSKLRPIKLNFDVLENAKDIHKDITDLISNLSKADERARSIVESVLTEEERRGLAIIEANKLYKAGLITLETYTRVIKANTDAMDAMIRPLGDAVVSMAQLGESALVDMFSGAGVSARDLANQVKHIMIQAIFDVLKAWIAAEYAKRAEAIKTAAVAAAAQRAGGSGGGGSASGSATGSVGQAAGAYQGISSSGVSTSALLGYAAIAYAAFVVWKGFFENTATAFGEMSTTGARASNSARYAAKAAYLISQLLSSIGATIKDLGIKLAEIGDVTLGVAGSMTYVKDIEHPLGIAFDSMQAALEYAQVRAIQLGRLADTTSAEMAAAIHDSHAMTLAAFREDIDFINRLESLGKPDIAKGIDDFVNTFHTDWQHALDLFRLDLEMLPTVLAQVGGELVQGFQSLYDQYTGHTRSIREQQEQIATIFNARLVLARAEITEQAAVIHATILRLQAGVEFTDGLIHETDVVFTAANLIMKAASASVGTLAALQAQEDALNALLAELNKIPLLKPEDVHIGGGTGRGSRAGSRDSVLSFLDDRRWQIASAAMDNLHRTLAQITRDYDAQLRAAGKDAKLREELLRLRQQETDAAIAANKADVQARYSELIGGSNPFADLHKKFADMAKDIRGAGYGAQRTASMLAALANAEDRAVHILSDQQAEGLLGDLAGYITDATVHAQLLRTQEILNYQAKLVEMETEYELLKAQGKLSAETLAALDKGFKWIHDHAADLPGGANWAGPEGGGTGTSTGTTPGGEGSGGHWIFNPATGGWTWLPDSAASDAANALKTAQDLLAKYEGQSVDELTSNIRQINDDFVTIHKAMGDNARIQADYAAAVHRAIDSFLKPIEDARKDLIFGSGSPFDVETQFASAQKAWLDAQAKFRAGDLSVVSTLPDLARQFLDLERQINPAGTTAYRTATTNVDAFLAMVQSMVPSMVANVGTTENPMNVKGIMDLAVIGEAQTDHLIDIRDSNLIIAAAVQSMDRKLVSATGSVAGIR